MITQHPGIQREIAVKAIPDDERVWVPQAPGVWFRPLLLNTVTGSWCNLLRVRKSGVLSRHAMIHTPPEVMAMWSMLPRVSLTLRSFRSTDDADRSRPSWLASLRSPSAPLAHAVVDWGSSMTNLAIDPILPVPQRSSIFFVCLAERRSYSRWAEAPASPASMLAASIGCGCCGT